MAKSAFEAYPRKTAVRLVSLMGGTGVLLLVAGFFDKITTFWAAGSIMILFAVGSWPKPAAKQPSAESPDASEAPQCSASQGPMPARMPRRAVEEAVEPDESLFQSAKRQIELFREELARRRGEKADSA